MLYGRRWSQVWVVTAIVASQIGSAEAHVGRGALAGRIVDPAGTAMPGATRPPVSDKSSTTARL